MTTQTKIRDTFTMDLGTVKGVEVEYEYTPAVPADPRCGHDAADREGEPMDVEIIGVYVGDGDLYPLLDEVYAKDVLDRAERVIGSRQRLDRYCEANGIVNLARRRRA